jgi:hypothetical protein
MGTVQLVKGRFVSETSFDPTAHAEVDRATKRIRGGAYRRRKRPALMLQTYVRYVPIFMIYFLYVR